MSEKKSKSLWDARIIRRALVDAVVKLDPNFVFTHHLGQGANLIASVLGSGSNNIAELWPSAPQGARLFIVD